MSQQPATPAIGPDELKTELQFLLSLEHALLVEYLTIYCAFGVDLPFDEGGPSDDGGAVAGAAFNLALDQMFALSGLAQHAGMPDSGTIGRAGSITGPDGTEISLEPLSPDQLSDVLATARAIAGATDARYAALELRLPGDPFDDLHGVVQGRQDHLGRVEDGLGAALGTVPAADLLRATRREGTTENERALLEASDLVYTQLLSQFTNQHRVTDFELANTFRTMARTSMNLMRDTHRALAHLGLLPPFTWSDF